MDSENQQIAKQNKRNKCMPIIVILAILAIGGLGFGGFGLWQSMQKDDSSKVILSVDKGNKLGEELFKQVQDIEATGACGQTVHPLYEGEFIISLETISRSDRFEIIARKMSEISKLESGEEVVVSEEALEEVYDSVFGNYSDIDYGVFGFSDSDSDEGTQSVRLSDYTISKIDDKKYRILFESDLKPECSQERYSDYYEYVGLSDTINNELATFNEEGGELAMVVIEKKTIDYADSDSEAKSNGYYGVLFVRWQDSEKYYWIGTYYLGNVIED